MNRAFYVNFGIIACSFSCLEADLRSLISGIVFRDEAVVASAFLDKSQFAENTTILKKLGRNFWEEKELFDKIVGQLHRIRDDRNSFIHGVWRPGNFGEPNGNAELLDLRTVYCESENQRKWKHGVRKLYSLKEFAVLLDTIENVRSDIKSLCMKLENAATEEGIHLDFNLSGVTTAYRPQLMRLTPEGELVQIEIGT